MTFIEFITSNYYINAAVLSWLTAQTLKALVAYFQTKKFHSKRLYGAGGMPSSHSATVCALAIAVLRVCGFDSIEFAFAFVFASIVMYDALSVRRQAGEHAKQLNYLSILFPSNMFEDELKDDNDPDSAKRQDKHKTSQLNEYLGHTPFQVLVGAVLGILIASLMPME